MLTLRAFLITLVFSGIATSAQGWQIAALWVIA
jgi:hypothetical protein